MLPRKGTCNVAGPFSPGAGRERRGVNGRRACGERFFGSDDAGQYDGTARFWRRLARSVGRRRSWCIGQIARPLRGGGVIGLDGHLIADFDELDQASQTLFRAERQCLGRNRSPQHRNAAGDLHTQVERGQLRIIEKRLARLHGLPQVADQGFVGRFGSSCGQRKIFPIETKLIKSCFRHCERIMMQGLIPASGDECFAQFLMPGESSQAARESRQGRCDDSPRRLFSNSGDNR